MEDITFEKLPQAVAHLIRKVENLEFLLKQKVQPSNQLDNQLLNIQQVSELIHLQVPTIYSYVQKREIPFSKKGKRLYFSKDEIIDWVKKGKQKTASETQLEVDKFLTSKRK